MGYNNPFDEAEQRVDTSDLKLNKEKSTWLRLMPDKKEKNDFCFKYIQHWIPLKNGTSTPISHDIDTTCKLCRIRTQIYENVNNWEDEDAEGNKEKIEAWRDRARAIRKREVYDYNAIDRNYRNSKGEKELKIFRFTPPKSAQDSIVGLANETRASDGSLKYGRKPHDAEGGYDIVIDPVKKEGNKFISYDAKFEEHTPLLKEEISLLKKEGYDLKRMRKFTTAEKIDDLISQGVKWLCDFALVEYDDEEVDIEEINEKPKSKSKSKSKLVKTVQKEEPEADESEVEESESIADESEAESADNESEAESDESEAESDESEAESDESEAESDEESNTDDDDDLQEENDLFEDTECHGEYDEGDKQCNVCEYLDRCKALKKLAEKAQALDIEIYDDGEMMKLEDELKAEISKKESKSDGIKKRGKKNINF